MFDTIRKGQIVSGKFKIKNISRNTFELSQLITFCGCTTAKMRGNNNIIQPGNSSYLEFILDTDSFEEGYNERAVTI